MNLAFIGIGKLGICISALFSKNGYLISAYDKSVNSSSDLLSDSRLREPGLNIIKNNIKKFKIKKSLGSAIGSAETVFVCINTPSLSCGKYDTSGLFEICQKIKEKNIKNKTLVIVCTTNPGDCEKMQDILRENMINVVYTPEFIAQGSIIEDLSNPDMAIYGGEEDACRKIAEIYRKTFNKKVTEFYMSHTSAEIAKIAINSFLTIKISFANSIGQIMHKSDQTQEIKKVLTAIGSDSRIGQKFLNFGFGFGGPCLPRDNVALYEHAKSKGVNFNLGIAADELNKIHEDFLVEMLVSQNKKNLPFYFQTIFYKKGTKISSPSQRKNICVQLLDKGYDVIVKEWTDDPEITNRVAFGVPTMEVFNVAF